MYDAVTFDTQTVKSNSFDFDGGVLKLLTKLRHDTIAVVVTEVVFAEIRKHLTDHTQQIISGLETALKKARDFGVADIPMPLTGRDPAKLIAYERLRNYVAALDAVVISSAEVNTADVLKRYFLNLPPFSNAKKKAEFPDAVSLLSLEKWAESKNYKVLAISGDSDWAAFGEQSQHIDVVSDITAALDVLNGQLSETRLIVGKALDQVDGEGEDRLRCQFSRALEKALEDLSIGSEGENYNHIEGEQAELTLQGWSLTHVPSFELLYSDEENSRFVVSVDAEVDVSAKADFYISEYDRGDGDFFPLGMTTATVHRHLELKLLVTILRLGDTFGIGGIEVHKAPSFIDFGEVELDFSNDYFDHIDDPLDHEDVHIKPEEQSTNDPS